MGESIHESQQLACINDCRYPHTRELAFRLLAEYPDAVIDVSDYGWTCRIGLSKYRDGEQHRQGWALSGYRDHVRGEHAFSYGLPDLENHLKSMREWMAK